MRDVTDPQAARAAPRVTSTGARIALIESLADGVVMVDVDGPGRPGQRGVRGAVPGPAHPHPRARKLEEIPLEAAQRRGLEEVFDEDGHR